LLSPAPTPPYGSTLSVYDGYEGGEFRLFAADHAGADTGFLTTWTLNMTLRDGADTGFTVASARVEEGGKAVLEVKRTGQPTLGPATVLVTTEGAAAAGADFTAPPATLQFAAGETSKTIEVPIADDQVDEAVERFKVVLSALNGDAKPAGNASVEIAIGPDNAFRFGKVVRNERKGTARLFVKVPGPGVLVVSGKGVKKVKKTVKKAGNVGVPIKPKGKTVGVLAGEGEAKVRAKVAFTPSEGSVSSKTKKVKLVLED
jgi:Calx-beta domain